MDIETTQKEIVAELGGSADWFDKYEHLLGLGRLLPQMDPRLKRDDTRIQGCQSEVWIYAEPAEGGLRLIADSDSLITRGIISLLLRVLNRQPPVVIAEADLFFLERTGLSSNLSPSRANGLSLIVQRIKELAKEATP